MIEEKAIKITKKVSITVLDKKILTKLKKSINKANFKYLPIKLLTIIQHKYNSARQNY
jgi:hypothetical protein